MRAKRAKQLRKQAGGIELTEKRKYGRLEGSRTLRCVSEGVRRYRALKKVFKQASRGML